MGIRLGAITEWASSLLGSYKIPFTTGSLTRLVRMDTLADWVLKTYTGFLQSGNTGVATDVQSKLRWNTVSPLDFVSDTVRADVTGLAPTLDHTPYILDACAKAVAQGKGLDFGGYTWLLKTQLALTSTHNNCSWLLRGATIKKGFSGDLCTVASCSNFSVEGVGTIDGQHGTYTGRGFVFSGSNSTRPFFGAGIVFTSFTDSHIEFGADSGTYAKVLCDFYPGSGQTDYRAVYVNGPDTTARHRHFSAHTVESGYHQLAGAQSTEFTGVICKRIVTDSATTVLSVTGGSWSNGGSAITVSAANAMVIGVRISGDVTLDANFSGIFIPWHTSGVTTDSAGNGSALVLAKNGTTGFCQINKYHTLFFPSAAERIITSRTANVADSDLTATVGSNAPVIIFNTTSSARVVTLSTTGAIAGDRFRVVNKGASNVSVGGLKTLVGGANNWCDVEYDGSGTWILTGFGAL